MTEIKLNKRYKYAGDIMPKLLEIGFDLETAQDFLNSIKDADVAPKSEVAREILTEIYREAYEEINHYSIRAKCVELGKKYGVSVNGSSEG